MRRSGVLTGPAAGRSLVRLKVRRRGSLRVRKPLAARGLNGFAVVVAAALLLLGPALSGTANAGVDHDGRWSGTSRADGSFAEIFGNGFSPRSHQCVLYSVLTFDDSAPRQVEAGLARCSGAAIDGSCANGHVFVETTNGIKYSCTQGYTFKNNVGYDATTYRTGSYSRTVRGHIDGATRSISGFGLKDWTKAETWGEATGGSRCPGPSKGTFHSWERYDTSTGWHYVTKSLIHRVRQGMAGAPCWRTVSRPTSIGDYHVN